VPEILEIEYYRRAAETLVGRTVATVEVDDGWVRGAGPAAVSDVLVGATVGGVDRHGKLLLVGLDPRPTLGIRFGMTGRLVVDGIGPIHRLEYASGRDDPAWDRLVVTMADGGVLRVNDPRRLGSVEIDPDVSRLGPDAWTLDIDALAAALDSDVALKTRLMDQRRIAGLGNLLADEILWRAGIAPGRAARSLSADEVAVLARAIPEALDDLFAAGGSHMGALQPVRDLSGPCPRDGATLRRETIGGRTAIWCPHHQH
jgi:formamidopyrimidine-DNA glycosylase